MKKYGSLVWLLVALSAGCAPTIPPVFQTAGSSTLDGPVLAMAESGGVVVAATPAGLFRREAGGPWTRVESPGLRKMSRVTALAQLGGELFVGTRGDGLHILSGGTWEVLKSRYGGLPDDRVLCLAVDPGGAGFLGADVWAGTAKGLALRRNGKWETFRPGKRWLWELVGAAVPREGKTYLTEAYSLGDSSGQGGFLPPVRAIGLDKDRAILGGDSRLAILDANGFASVRLDGDYQVTSLLVEEAIIWAGTSRGLLWGGRLGAVERFPYPGWRPSVGSRGVLFGARDSRPYHHIWRQFGFNLARVEGIARDGQNALWVAFNAGGRNTGFEPSTVRSADPPETDTSLRRYLNLEEYLETGDKPHYEVYGKAQGVAGVPTALAYSGELGGVLVGTTAGFVVLN